VKREIFKSKKREANFKISQSTGQRISKTREEKEEERAKRE